MLLLFAALPLCASTPPPPSPTGCQDWACEELDFPSPGWQPNPDCCAISDRGRCTPGLGLYTYIRAEQCVRGCANYFCCSFSATPPPGVRVASSSSLPTWRSNLCPDDRRRGAAGLLFAVFVLGGTVYLVRRIRRRQQERWEQQSARQRALAQARDQAVPSQAGGATRAVQGIAVANPESLEGVVQGAPVAHATAVPAVGDGSNVVQATVVSAVAVPVARQETL